MEPMPIHCIKIYRAASEAQPDELLLVLHVHNLGGRKFVQTMLTISATDTGLATAGMETLHGFEILTVDVAVSYTHLTLPTIYSV